MAESGKNNNVLSELVPDGPGVVECAVCLQACVHPAELPCGHIFCYLCIKGIVNQGRRCAMCRQDIPIDFLDKPRLVKPYELESDPKAFEDGHQWFYEGHNGWWQYDERTSLELETAYQKGDRCCELLVAGFLYIADFNSMLQFRRHDPARRRRIKRDLATTTKKGVAGLKTAKEAQGEQGTAQARNVVSSVLVPGMQNLHISSRAPGARLARSRGALASRLRRRNSFSPTRTSFLPTPPPNESPSDEHLYSRSTELDTMIHDTLDWTIQQIESLQFELSNDYETLTQGVDQYERLFSDLRRPSDPAGPRRRLNRSEENVAESGLESDAAVTSMQDRLLMRSRSTGFAADVSLPRGGSGRRMRSARSVPRRSSSLRSRQATPPAAEDPQSSP